MHQVEGEENLEGEERGRMMSAQIIESITEKRRLDDHSQILTPSQFLLEQGSANFFWKGPDSKYFFSPLWAI